MIYFTKYALTQGILAVRKEDAIETISGIEVKKTGMQVGHRHIFTSLKDAVDNAEKQRKAAMKRLQSIDLSSVTEVVS